MLPAVIDGVADPLQLAPCPSTEQEDRAGTSPAIADPRPRPDSTGRIPRPGRARVGNLFCSRLSLARRPRLRHADCLPGVHRRAGAYRLFHSLDWSLAAAGNCKLSIPPDDF